VTENVSSPYQAPTSPPAGAVPPQGVPMPYRSSSGPLGRPRSTGVAMLLFFVTFGVYGWYWYYVTHDEMKRHTGTGIGGPIALVLAVFVGIASPFITSSEVGGLYERAGQRKPVTGATGLWVFPGVLLLVLPIVWFLKTNGALNAYWRAYGAR
jgi:hypothetical protein